MVMTMLPMILSTMLSMMMLMMAILRRRTRRSLFGDDIGGFLGILRHVEGELVDRIADLESVWDRRRIGQGVVVDVIWVSVTQRR